MDVLPLRDRSDEELRTILASAQHILEVRNNASRSKSVARMDDAYDRVRAAESVVSTFTRALDEARSAYFIAVRAGDITAQAQHNKYRQHRQYPHERAEGDC